MFWFVDFTISYKKKKQALNLKEWTLKMRLHNWNTTLNRRPKWLSCKKAFMYFNSCKKPFKLRHLISKKIKKKQSLKFPLLIFTLVHEVGRDHTTGQPFLVYALRSARNVRPPEIDVVRVTHGLQWSSRWRVQTRYNVRVRRQHSCFP